MSLIWDRMADSGTPETFLTAKRILEVLKRDFRGPHVLGLVGNWGRPHFHAIQRMQWFWRHDSCISHILCCRCHVEPLREELTFAFSSLDKAGVKEIDWFPLSCECYTTFKSIWYSFSKLVSQLAPQCPVRPSLNAFCYARHKKGK